VTGDEVRNVRFRRHGDGYDVSQVDDLLGRIAVELDAGRPAGPLIADARFRQTGGYEIDAVDLFLDQLRRREDHSGRAGMSADPWRDLAVANYFTRSGPGGLAERTAAPSGRARREYTSGDRKYFDQECADAWRDFGQQPGTHLRWIWAGAVRRNLQAAGQQTIASLRYGRTASVTTGGRTFTRKRGTASSWPDIAAIVGRSRQDNGPGHYLAGETPYDWKLQAVDTSQKPAYFAPRGPRLTELADEAGMPILYTSGRHFGFSADAFITFPDQRCLRFPVRGTDRPTAIMTAVDQAGNKVARYRTIGKLTTIWWTTIGISVHPGQQLTDELALALAISAPWLRSYFLTQGGG